MMYHIMSYHIVLYLLCCIVLYCIVLYCIVLYCIVLYCIVQNRTTIYIYIRIYITPHFYLIHLQYHGNLLILQKQYSCHNKSVLGRPTKPNQTRQETVEKVYPRTPYLPC